MNRSMFIQYEIANMYVDDFMVLPATRVFRHVYKPLSSAYQRLNDSFLFTH